MKEKPSVCADGWCLKLFVAFIAAVLFIVVIAALAVGYLGAPMTAPEAWIVFGVFLVVVLVLWWG